MKKRGLYLTKGKIAKTKATTKFSPKAKQIANEVLKKIRKEEDRRLMLKHEYGEIEEQTIKRLDQANLRVLKRYSEEKKLEKQIEEMLKEKKQVKKK